MVIRISSALVVALALVAACGQKAAQQEPVVNESSEKVNNGGFNQYYWNSTGKFADEAVAAFEYFAAHQHAELMREANRIHAAEQAQIEKFKEQGTLQAFSDSYKLDENLSALIVAKIRADPASFSMQ